MEDGRQHILDQADDNAVNGAQAEGRQQRGQLGQIHLDESGDQHGDGEIEHHQDATHGGQHGSDGKGTDLTFGLHNITSRPETQNTTGLFKILFESRQQV